MVDFNPNSVIRNRFESARKNNAKIIINVHSFKDNELGHSYRHKCKDKHIESILSHKWSRIGLNVITCLCGAKINVDTYIDKGGVGKVNEVIVNLYLRNSKKIEQCPLTDEDINIHDILT